MAKLRKFTLSYDKKKDDWVLKEDGSSRAKKRFANKTAAMKTGVLQGLLGSAGGSVSIEKQDGEVQAERTYPGTMAPKRLLG